MTLLPLAKLGYLAIRTISKPLAGRLKNAAATSPVFRNTCIRAAQFYHTTEVQFRLRLLGHPVTKIKPLDEAKAVTLATEVLGEIIIFTIAGAVVVIEVASSRAKDQAKEAALNERFKSLEDSLAVSKEEIRQLQADNLELMKHSKYSPDVQLIRKKEADLRQSALDSIVVEKKDDSLMSQLYTFLTTRNKKDSDEMPVALVAPTPSEPPKSTADTSLK